MAIWSGEIKDLETLYKSVSGQFPDLEKELEQLLMAENENVVLLYSRRCLEVMVTDLCETELNRPRKTEPLKGIIEKLNKEEKVPSHIITSMLNLNSLSAYGTHPKEFDPEQVKPVLSNLSIIIKWFLQTIGSDIKPGQTDVQDENKELLTTKESTRKHRKRMILLVSGFALVVALVVVALFVFKIIGEKKQIEEPERSIAVLPFENMSDDSEFAHLGNAITDEIIMQLYKINAFEVRSRTSIMQYKNTEKGSPVIGKELNVNYLLEGSAQRYKDQVRIRVQLIQAETDDHIWGNIYEGNWNEIFDIQKNVAKEVARELATVLSPEEVEKIEDEPTQNLDAYNLYLLGRYFWNQGGRDGYDKSIEYYKRALEIDQDYALAYSGMAATYTSYFFSGLNAPSEVIPHAKEAALKALEIDSTLGEAHAELAHARVVYDWDWTGGEKGFKRALELNPNHANAHHQYAWLLTYLGRLDEAIQESRRAHELDPLSAGIWVGYGRRYYYARDYDRAIEEYQKVLELFPDDGYARFELATALSQKGLHKEAIEECLNIEIPNAWFRLGYIYGAAGEREKALEILDYFLELSKKEFVWTTGIAVIYIGLGEKDKAFEWLEKTYERHELGLDILQVAPQYDPLRPDPRFQDLVARMNFPDQL